MFSGLLFKACTPSFDRCSPCPPPDKVHGPGAPTEPGTVKKGSDRSTPGGGLRRGGGLCDGPDAGGPGPETLHSESQVPWPLRASNRAPRLTVPSVFSRFQFSVIYTQLGATQGMLMDQQKSMLQAILKHFTKELSHGFVVLCVHDSDGRATEYACNLDRGMTQLVMQPYEPRAVAMLPMGQGAFGQPPTPSKALVFAEIERICSPEEVRNLRGANLLVLDECCTTVVLTKQRFITFRLESVAAREYLMLCLQVLRMSQEKARMWYP